MLLVDVGIPLAASVDDEQQVSVPLAVVAGVAFAIHCLFAQVSVKGGRWKMLFILF